MNLATETYIPMPLPYVIVTSGTGPEIHDPLAKVQLQNRTEKDDPTKSGIKAINLNAMFAEIRLPSIVAGLNIEVSLDPTLRLEVTAATDLISLTRKDLVQTARNCQTSAIATSATADIEQSTSAVASTTGLRSEEVDTEIRDLFRLGRDVLFEDGMENEFSKSLVAVVSRHGHCAIDALFALIFVDGKISEEVAGEALQTLGDMEHPSTYLSRQWLFEQSLTHPSRYVRDGAALGLSSLNNPHAIPYLKRAIEQEDLKELRKDLRKVLTELEGISQWPLF